MRVVLAIAFAVIMVLAILLVGRAILETMKIDIDAFDLTDEGEEDSE